MKKIFYSILLLSLIILTGCTAGSGQERFDCFIDFCHSYNQTYFNSSIFVPDYPVCLDSNYEIHKYNVDCVEALNETGD